MKKLTLTISEFLNFRATCERFRIQFSYEIIRGHAIVRADREALKTIGF